MHFFVWPCSPIFAISGKVLSLPWIYLSMLENFTSVSSNGNKWCWQHSFFLSLPILIYFSSIPFLIVSMLESSHIFAGILLGKCPNASIAADFSVSILEQVLFPRGTSWTKMFWEKRSMEIHAVGFISFYLQCTMRVSQYQSFAPASSIEHISILPGCSQRRVSILDLGF